MKMYKANIIFLTIILIISCEADKEYELLTGTLVGYVNLVDFDNEGSDIADYSGIEIDIEGSNPRITTVTDETGQFIINDLQSGTYNIIYKKDGFCTYKIVGHQFVGGNKPSSVGKLSLYGIHDAQIDNFSITSRDYSYTVLLEVEGKVTKEEEHMSRMIRYYLGKTPDVSYENYVYTGTEGYYRDGRISFLLSVDTTEFPSGTEMYMILYPASESSQSYIDIKTGTRIYSTINRENASEVASITIPDVESSNWFE